MKVLVVGATGILGSEICSELSKKGHHVRGVIRPTSDKSKVDRLKSMGVEPVEADLKETKSVEMACRGEQAVITTASITFSRQPGDSIETVDAEGQLNLVDAAKREGVRRFVYTSYSGGISEPCPLTDAKRGVEKRVKASGLEYTILRPTYYMESWLSPSLGFDYANAKATIYGTGEKGISWISLFDVARFGAASLDKPEVSLNRTLELGGPKALSPLETVKIFERATGRKFAIQNVPVEALVQQRDSAPDSLQKSFAALCLAVANGDAIDMREMLKSFPMRLTSVEEYAKRVSSGAP